MSRFLINENRLFNFYHKKKKVKENSFVSFKAGRGCGLIFAKLKRIAVVLGRDMFFLKLIYHCYDSKREISGYRRINRSQTNQAPVVLRLDSTIERINHYPSEKYYNLLNCPNDSVLFNG